MGMARSDFEGCTPEEFYHAHAQWAEREQQHERAAWEQTRIIALCTLQPHSSHPLTPAEVLPLPWDKEQAMPQELTKEELQARYEAALERYGFRSSTSNL